MPIGADILDQGGAGMARDVGKVFNSPAAMLDRKRNHVVPRFGGVNLQRDRLGILIEDRNTPVHGVYYQAVEPPITDKDVASSAQDEESEVVCTTESQRFSYLVRSSDVCKKARRSSDFEGGIRLERLV